MSTTDSREAFLEWKRNEGGIPNYIPDATIMASGYSDFELKAWQAALAWQAATEAAKAAQEEDSQIRWCANGQIFGRPTATDALEYAEQRLRDPEEMICCKSDVRLDAMLNVRELLSAAKATGTSGEHSHQGNRYGNLTDAEYIEMTRQEAARQPAPVVAAEIDKEALRAEVRLRGRIHQLEDEIADLRAALAARNQP